MVHITCAKCGKNLGYVKEAEYTDDHVDMCHRCIGRIIHDGQAGAIEELAKGMAAAFDQNQNN